MNHRNVLRSYGLDFSVLCMLVLVGVFGIANPLALAEEAATKPAAKPVETMDVTVNDAVGVLHIDLIKFRFDLLKTLTTKTKTMKLTKEQINTILKCATVINTIDVLFLLGEHGFPEPIGIVRGKISPQDFLDMAAAFGPEVPKLKPLANGRYKLGDAMFIYGKQADDVPDGMLIISSPKMQGEKTLASIAAMTTLPQSATIHKPDTTKPIWGAMKFTVSQGNGRDETFDISGSGDPSGKGKGTILFKVSDEYAANEMVEGYSKAKERGDVLLLLNMLEMVADGDTVKITIAGKENIIAEAIDALFDARAKAKRAVSMCNAKGIVMAVQLYADDNNGDFPKKFETLIKEGSIGARMLVSPVSGKKPPIWDDKKMALTGDVDYVLLNYGTLTHSDVDQQAEMIVVYEKPENYKNKETVVGYVDGHVEWVKIEDFKKQLKETEDWIKENN